MSERNELVSQFSDVTGVDGERARFYLESSAWQLEVALASFYENDGEANPVPGDDSDVMVEPPTPPQDTSPPPPPRTTAPKPATASSRLCTLAELTRATSDSSDEEEGQAFYAGGSEHSGQQVLGPGKKKKNIVSAMFKSVKEHGAEVVDLISRKGGRSSTFSGAGYRLGQSSNDTEVIGLASSDRRQSHTEVVLKMWKEGFSINDGPLRRYSDPDNREFLTSVRNGEIPMELLREGLGSEIHLNMEDHSHDEFKVQKQKLQAFSGKGHLLGSPAPAAVGTVKPLDEKDRAANEEQAKSSVALNPGEPVTTIQVRLADGSRLVGQFNHTHTIGDVRRFIVTARPQYQNLSFNLLTTFPSKELSDDGAKLSDAGVLNATVMQRLT
ncbi:LOW QUALITY PROTEIN: NSFL1 cofactor p47-like [Bacillus rossius redtenbacheri]|uniref:LOW QUALITY PROTEIN: NSFL1 cofactor p47-like n=1 Tax=Bacillus rossius redtenbacheri TaxID=93214 RepID=UPI002FDC99FC